RFDAGVPGGAERAEELAGRIVEVCVEEGGSLTGEHGIGVDKKRYMPKMFSEADLEAFQRLRCAFDPDGRVNPGKVMPTPRLCGEVPGPYRQHPLEAAGVIERLRGRTPPPPTTRRRRYCRRRAPTAARRRSRGGERSPA